MDAQLIGRPGLARALNVRAVLEAIAVNGPLSRVELARGLGLSQASVSRLADELLRVGLLKEGAKVASKAGRKQTLLELNASAALVAGVSLRSQFVRVMLSDLKGTTLVHRKVARERRSVERLVAQIRALMSESITELSPHAPAPPLAAAVVGISGAWDGARGRVYAAPNLPELEGVDLLGSLRDGLEGLVPSEGIALDNDVNHAAVGEFTYGAARGCESFFYLNLGSGVGGGAVVGGRLHRGFQGFAGEVGLLPVYVDGAYHPLERLVSRLALEGHAQTLGFEGAAGLLEEARAGDAAAYEVVQEVGHLLGAALCSVAALLNPQRIVIGGSIGRYSDVLIPSITKTLRRFLPLQPTIVGTALGGDAALRGAASQALGLAREVIVAEELI